MSAPQQERFASAAELEAAIGEVRETVTFMRWLISEQLLARQEHAIQTGMTSEFAAVEANPSTSADPKTSARPQIEYFQAESAALLLARELLRRGTPRRHIEVQLRDYYGVQAPERIIEQVSGQQLV